MYVPIARGPVRTFFTLKAHNYKKKEKQTLMQRALYYIVLLEEWAGIEEILGQHGDDVGHEDT